MTDTHHLLPSFTWDALTASWVPYAPLNGDTQTSTFGVKSNLILDTVKSTSLPTPLYRVGEEITFTVSNGVAFSGHILTRQGVIVAIRLIGQRYCIEPTSELGKEQRHSRAFWTQKCYGVDRVVYIVQNEDCTPWVDGYRIIGRAVQGEEDSKGEDTYDFSGWNSEEQEEEAALTFI